MSKRRNKIGSGAMHMHCTIFFLHFSTQQYIENIPQIEFIERLQNNQLELKVCATLEVTL